MGHIIFTIVGALPMCGRLVNHVLIVHRGQDKSPGGGTEDVRSGDTLGTLSVSYLVRIEHLAPGRYPESPSPELPLKRIRSKA